MSGLLNRFFGPYQEGGSADDANTVKDYEETEVGSPIGGRRRRHRSLKRPKRRSRANKRSRKHYGGKSQEEQEEEQEEQEQEEQEQEEQEQEEEESTRGGKRRRKGRRGKKTRGKTSSWIKHVLKFAKDNKMKYSQALKDKRCRSTYKSHKK